MKLFKILAGLLLIGLAFLILDSKFLGGFLRISLLRDISATVDNLTPTGSLEVAISNDDVAAARNALRDHADPNVRGPEGETLLMSVCGIPGNFRMAKTLLDGGADPNLKDLEGQTALMSAAVSGDVRLVNLLFAKGAVYDQRAYKIAVDANFKDIISAFKLHSPK